MRWGERIDAANRRAVDRMLAVEPRWVDVLPLRQVVSGLGERDVLHAGPPVEWMGMSGAQQGAVIGAVLSEGWADTAEGARRLAESRGIRLASCHGHAGVAPGASAVSPSSAVFVLDDPHTGARAWAPLSEPRAGYGVYDEDAVSLSRFMRADLAPILGRVVTSLDGLGLLPLLAQALMRGDELHQRCNAFSDRVLVSLMPALVSAGVPKSDLQTALETVAGDHAFFAPLALAAAKLIADAGADVEDSTVVTAVASNGTEIGIQVSGLGTRWFRAPAPLPEGWTMSGDGGRGSDAGAIVGDGAVLEAMGLGASALPGSASSWGLLGVDQQTAFDFAAHVHEVTVGEHFVLRVPALDRGARMGIDVRKAVEKNTRMAIAATVPHREAGQGSLGQAIARLPWACFVSALEAFAADRGIQ